MLEEQFKEAQEQVVKLKTRPSTDVMLDLYGLYKQATMGDVQGARPGILDLKGRAKFDAWTGKEGMSNEQAKQAYVDLVNKLLSQE